MQHTPHRPHVPAGLVVALIVIVSLPIIGAGAWLWTQWRTLELVSPAVAYVLRLFVLGTLAASPALALWGAWRRWARLEMIQADKIISLTDKQRALPAGVQSVSWHDSSRQLPAPPIEETQPLALPPPSVPTFAQLLDQGQVGPGRQLILGYADGQALTGSWSDLYSCGIGGMTGSGKSWAIAFLAGQSAAAGARIILIDPHAGDPESLANRLAGLQPSFMCDVASTGSEIESALKLAADKLERRKTGKGGTWPLLLIVDEWTSLLRGKMGDLLTATALDYAEQGRKFGCFAMLAAQAWQVDAAGAVRDRLASHYVLRTRGDQFRYQTGLRSASAPADTLTLQAGQAYMLSVRGDLVRVTIPTMTQADILRLGTLVDKPAAATGAHFGFTLPATQPLTPITAAMPERSQNVAGRVAATRASQSATRASAEATRAADLFVAGKSPAEIVTEMRGVKSNEGSRYQNALAEVLNLIREGIQG